MTQPSQAPGWYPDPSDPARNIYWDGTGWSGPASAPAGADKSNISKQTAVAVGVFVLVGIGLVMSMQSVSLLTGSGTVWTGVAVVAGGTAVAFFLRAAVAVRVVAAVALVIAVLNGIYIEKQLSDKRSELTHMFDHL